MESSRVIKVKYGETLRRFNGHVSDGKLCFSMDGLRDKIVQLFSFAPGAEFILTYIDEDGDIVTLVDEEDLHDITRQNLNPLRITVSLNAEIISKPSATRGNYAPRRSRVHPACSDLLRSLPESESKRISKALRGNIGISHLKKALKSQRASETVSQGPAFGSTTDVDDEPISQAFPIIKCGDPSLKKKETFPGADADEKTSETPDQNEAPCESFSKGPKPNTSLVDGKKEEGKNFGDCNLVGKALGISYSSAAPTSVPVVKDAVPPQHTPSENPFKWSHIRGDGTSKVFHNGVGCDGCGVYPITGPRFKSKVKKNYDLCSACSLLKGNDTDYIRMDHPATFHYTVCCDGCGAHPITGPRFKSKVTEDYDLCRVCFAQMGNDVDYIRMDGPDTFPCPLAFKHLNDPHGRMQYSTFPHPSHACEVKLVQSKLDSCFIQDVNVLDNTIMSPLTPFTKIWRMRNDGNSVWPQGTKVVWIGGDKLSDTLSVELQITSVGLAVGQEFDVAVNFTAPELPGRYISYWRMASPSGQMFGQRLWVLIQVDAFVSKPNRELLGEVSQDFDLNFPPASSCVAEPESIDPNAALSLDDIISEPKLSDLTMDLVEPVVDGNPNKDKESKSSINQSLLTVVGDNSSVSPSTPGLSISGPIDLSGETEAVSSDAPTSVTVVLSSTPDPDVGGNSELEKTLLKELEEMGFKEIALNKEILRTNKYDLGQAVDDLCVVAEWDPILEELEEMGFSNKEVNRELLKKNNGSIKGVVMDLIAGEN